MRNAGMVGLGLMAAAVCMAAPAPPSQPLTGPGGADYKHRRVVSSAHGDGGTQYWIFEPAEPKPERAPLVVFNHGWAAMATRAYTEWIHHIVKRGHVVVYPRYQANLMTPPDEFTPNAIAAIKGAITKLRNEAGRVQLDLDKFALVGHSMGGVVSANVAALAAKAGLPRLRALMCVQPGRTWGVPPRMAVKLEDLGQIPAETLLLTMAGDRDGITGDKDAKRIFREATRVPAENKDFVLMVSDDRGRPALEADHFAPVTAHIWRSVDALDYYGTWKLFDALCEAAFHGRNREFALGNTMQQRFMGKWSDGVPVKELVVTDKP